LFRGLVPCHQGTQQKGKIMASFFSAVECFSGLCSLEKLQVASAALLLRFFSKTELIAIGRQSFCCFAVRWNKRQIAKAIAQQTTVNIRFFVYFCELIKLTKAQLLRQAETLNSPPGKKVAVADWNSKNYIAWEVAAATIQ
jgi:hypothetical protein